jgi:hypothetical protein
MDRLGPSVKSRSTSNRPRLALRARYRDSEIAIEARESAAIVAVIVLVVVVALAAMAITSIK